MTPAVSRYGPAHMVFCSKGFVTGCAVFLVFGKNAVAYTDIGNGFVAVFDFDQSAAVGRIGKRKGRLKN